MGPDKPFYLLRDSAVMKIGGATPGRLYVPPLSPSREDHSHFLLTYTVSLTRRPY